MNVKKEMLAGGAALVSLAGLAFAGYQYRSSHREYYRPFDVQKIEKLTGKVLDVLFTGKKNSESRGVEFLLETDETIVPVNLGPAWFINKQRENFNIGDKVTIKGSRVVLDHKPVIVAQEIKKGNKWLRLRDEHGAPYWTVCKRFSLKN